MGAETESEAERARRLDCGAGEARRLDEQGLPAYICRARGARGDNRTGRQRASGSVAGRAMPAHMPGVRPRHGLLLQTVPARAR